MLDVILDKWGVSLILCDVVGIDHQSRKTNPALTRLYPHPPTTTPPHSGPDQLGFARPPILTVSKQYRSNPMHSI